MTEQEILAYLERDKARRIDMIEAIRRKNAKVLHAEPGAVLISTREWLALLACDTVEDGISALAHWDEACDGIVAHSEAARDAVKAVFPGFSHIRPCWQAYYAGTEPIPMPDVCEVRPFRKEDIPFVLEHYDVISSPEYFEERIEQNELFAGYRDGKLCAFIGFHDDGSGGMLEVLPEYRRLGIGSAMEIFLNNEALRRGWTPFGQIFVGNVASQKLQESLGLIMADGEIYWMTEEQN